MFWQNPTYNDARQHLVPCENNHGTVVQVYDSQTLGIRMSNGSYVRGRLKGIVAPMYGEPCAESARGFVERFSRGGCVHIEGPPTGMGRYMPVTVYTEDGVSLAAFMCARGYARAEETNPVLLAAQRLAYQSNLGIWATYDLPESEFDIALRKFLPYMIIIAITLSILIGVFQT